MPTVVAALVLAGCSDVVVQVEDAAAPRSDEVSSSGTSNVTEGDSSTGTPMNERAVMPSPSALPQAPVPVATEASSGSTVVVLADGLGDVLGNASGSPSAVVDLASVAVDAVGDELVVTYRMDEMPEAARAPQVLNLVTFLDLDRDGAADEELWATLTEHGWQGSHLRRTESGAMGVQPSSSVAITPHANAVVVAVDARVLALPPTFDFVVASEDGLAADYRAGETWRDVAPDEGVATWPASGS